MSEDKKRIIEHTAEEIAEGIEPTFTGIDEVGKVYDRYIDRQELEK